MNGYGLTAAIFQSVVSLGWPIAFVAVAWIFKKELKALLPRLRLKYKDMDVSFRLDEAEKEAQNLPASTQASESPPPTPEERNKFEKLAELSPRSAILELYSELEDAIQTFAIAIGLVQEGAHRPHWAVRRSVIRKLRQHELIDSTTAALLDDLRAIRNNAAHNPDVMLTTEDALRFRELTEKLVRQFNIATAAASMNKGASTLPP
jgi:uncharacterized protein DUF4145